MLFDSHEYVFFFLPIVVAIYHLLGHAQASKLWLLVASLAFYSWWNPAFTPLLIASIVANYTLGMRLLERPSRPLLTVAITANLALLGYFKYANFFLEIASEVSGMPRLMLHVILPLAISFYTFQQIAFLVDAHKQKIEHRTFLDYALFATFFPHLIAGPILHHKPMIAQFSQPRSTVVNYDNIARGLFLFAIGLCKVLIVAEPLSAIVNQGYSTVDSLSMLDSWVVAISFMLQLYFDFSGYSDMAIASALMLGIVVPDNFNSPYRMRNMAVFWQTWHITLGRYFRDYFLIPFTGRKASELRRSLLILCTFLLIGLWHGASWNFVVFGLANGLAILAVRNWPRTGIKLPYLAAWLATILFVMSLEILFRASDLEQAIMLFGHLLNWHGTASVAYTLPDIEFMPGLSFMPALLALPMGVLICAWPVNSIHWRQRFTPARRYLGVTIALFLLAALKMSMAKTFIYFQF